MFERFTDQAREVVVLAQEEARDLGHNYVGSEHILLGLLRVNDGLAARVLESFGLSVEKTRAQVVRIAPGGDKLTSGQIPFTPRSKKVLELSLREALSLGHDYIGPEHILLGLLRENEGVAVRILGNFDAETDTVRNEVIRLVATAGGSQRGRVTPVGVGEFRFTVGPDRELRRLLMAAARLAVAAERDEFRLADLLAAAEESRKAPDAEDTPPAQ